MKERYFIVRYGRWLYAIYDIEKDILVRKPGKEHITSKAYDKDGAVFLTFKTEREAIQKWRELDK